MSRGLPTWGAAALRRRRLVGGRSPGSRRRRQAVRGVCEQGTHYGLRRPRRRSHRHPDSRAVVLWLLCRQLSQLPDHMCRV